MAKKKKKKRVLKKKIIFFLFIVLCLFIYKILNTNISNIYISGNDLYSDQKIIDIAEISDYPNTIINNSIEIKNKLESDKYIYKVEVSKKAFLSKVYIKVKENYPLFYYLPEDNTVLFDGSNTKDKFIVPTLINVVPNLIYDEFKLKMAKVDKDILNKISEIEYKPNEVDEERFFILMNDGNYVYLTLYKFLNINKYNELVKLFGNKKGIFYLDSGEYFDVFN